MTFACSLEKNAYLVDGSTKTNEKMLKTTYAELEGEGFPLRYVVVTHPDIDHYGGINQVLGFNGVDSPQVLLTNRFSDKINKKMFGEQYIPVQSFPSELANSTTHLQKRIFQSVSQKFHIRLGSLQNERKNE